MVRTRSQPLSPSGLICLEDVEKRHYNTRNAAKQRNNPSKPETAAQHQMRRQQISTEEQQQLAVKRVIQRQKSKRENAPLQKQSTIDQKADDDVQMVLSSTGEDNEVHDDHMATDGVSDGNEQKDMDDVGSAASKTTKREFDF